jgi:hypothetical protein
MSATGGRVWNWQQMRREREGQVDLFSVCLVHSTKLDSESRAVESVHKTSRLRLRDFENSGSDSEAVKAQYVLITVNL